jgi:hypothetical protein
MVKFKKGFMYSVLTRKNLGFIGKGKNFQIGTGQGKDFPTRSFSNEFMKKLN